MVATVGSIAVLFTADMSKYSAQLRRGQKYTRDATGRMRRDVQTLDRQSLRLAGSARALGGSLASLRPIIGGLGVGVAAKQFLAWSEASTRLRNALRVAGLEGQTLEKVQNELAASAMRNGAPVESLVELYGKAALVQKELGVTSDELIGFTDKVAVALRVSGKSAAESSGALLQLSQALGAGTVRAEEFNSILEGAPTIAQAVAAGLKETGGSVARLRQLVVDGKVSSEAFFHAFEAGAVMLEEKAAKATLTVAQRTENLKTALILTAGEMNKSLGITEGLGNSLSTLAANVDRVGTYFEQNGPRIRQFFQQIADSWDWLERKKAGFRSALGLDVVDDWLKGTSLIEGRFGKFSDQQNEINNRVAGAFGNNDQRVIRAGKGGRVPANKREVEPVSIDDFAASTKGGSGGRQQVSEIEREIAAIRERTSAIQFEASIADATAVQQSRLRIEHELTAAALRSGVALTPELTAQISSLANEYTTAETALNSFGLRQQHIAQQQRVLASAFQGFAQDVVGGLREGETAAEAFGSAIERLANRLLENLANIAISAMISAIIPGGGMGAGMSPFMLFHEGGEVGRSSGRKKSLPTQMIANAPRFHDGLASDEFAAVLQRGEQVLTKPQKNIVTGALTSAMDGGGKGNTTVNIQNNTGAPVSESRRSGGGGEIVDIVIGVVSDAMSKGKFDKPMGRFGSSPMARRR